MIASVPPSGIKFLAQNPRSARAEPDLAQLGQIRPCSWGGGATAVFHDSSRYLTLEVSLCVSSALSQPFCPHLLLIGQKLNYTKSSWPCYNISMSPTCTQWHAWSRPLLITVNGRHEDFAELGRILPKASPDLTALSVSSQPTPEESQKALSVCPTY